MKKMLAMVLSLVFLASAVPSLADIGTADAPVPVTMLYKDMSSTDEGGIAFGEALEAAMAKQGMYIDFSFIDAPAGSYVEVVPLGVLNEVITADVLYFQGNTDTQVSQQGFLEDLRPVVEASTYLKDVMYPHNLERLENNPFILSAAPLDSFMPVIRKDIADTLETLPALLEDATIENYKAFLVELKEKEISEYGFCVYNDHLSLDSVFASAFGVTKTLVQDEASNWIYKHVTPQMKDLLAFYAELYAEGHIDPEYLTNTWDVAEEKLYSGKAAMLVGKAGATIDVYDNHMQSVHGEESALMPLPPAKGEAGQFYRAVDVSKEERGRGISVDSENKEAVAAVMDFMASPEGRVLDLYGMEGMHYDLVDGAIVMREDAPSWYGVFYSSQRGLDPELKAEAPLGEAGLSSMALAEEYYQADNNVILPSEYAANWDAMLSLFKEFASDVIRGQKSIDAFDDFVGQWNAAGGEKLGEYLATVMQ